MYSLEICVSLLKLFKYFAHLKMCNVCVLLKIVLILIPLCFHISFRTSLSSSLKKAAKVLIWIVNYGSIQR
jgi:hypothetical protein